jgi:dTMP kinase
MPGREERQALSNSSILVAVEGIDGAGKTTQVRLLKEALIRAGEEPIVSKEPTNGKWGKLIKESASTGRMSPDQELEAFINDRTEHLETLVGPSLSDGKIVILDRYFYSSIAYQGSRGANVAEVEAIMKARFPIPEAVYILDIDPLLSIHRIAHSRGEEPNHFENKKNLAKAREIFNSMSGPTIHRIDGTKSREAVHTEMLDHFIDGALKAKRCAKEYGCDDPSHCTFRLADGCQWAKMAKAMRSAQPAPLGRD